MLDSTRRLRLSLSVLAALAALLTAAPPAAADPLPDGCTILGGPYPAGPEIDVDNDGNPEATLPNPGASVCVELDSGLPDSPASFTCYGGLHECVLRITVGHTGAAEATAEACVESRPQVDPLCTTAETGTIPLVPVAPETICIGWSLQTPPCMVQHEDDQ